MLSAHNKSVNVNRLKLLEALRINRANHKRVFDLAYADFKNEKVRTLGEALVKAQLDSIEESAKHSLHITLEKPVNYLSQYDEVIEMMEMSVDENISLDSESFQPYFKDNWSWKSHFAGTNSKYLG